MLKRILAVFCALCAGCFLIALAAEGRQKPVQIGYCEGEAYYEFDRALNYFLQGLQEYGLIGAVDLPIDRESHATWARLAQVNQRDWAVQFVPTAFFSLSDQRYAELSGSEIADALQGAIRREGVDFMLSMGTVAGLATKELDCKTICIAAADAVSAGIVGTAETSGSKNVWAVMNTDAFQRSIMVMADIFHPKTVGVVYANNDAAYIYSGAKDLDAFARANGITVKKRFVDDPPTDSAEDMQHYYEGMAAAFTALSTEVDVFIVTTSLIDTGEMVGLLEPFFEQKIPTYSINTTDDVEHGTLMAAKPSDYKNVGRFAADTLRKCMDGAKLEQLPQIYQAPPFLAINYDTARRIGYRPTFDILLSAHRIFITPTSPDTGG